MPGPGALAASLLDEAAARTGGAGWGDESFLEALELMLGAWPGLTPFGRRVVARIVVRHLRNRAYLQEYVAEHPGAAHRPLTAALVITGLPRTGTTVLHNLLALDPANRVLWLWEALHPVPPDPRRGFGRDELVAAAGRWLAGMYELVHGFEAIHPGSAEGPEECDALLQNAFASQHFDDMLDVDAYSSWLYRAPLTAEYEYYGLQLRVLSADGDPRPWVLKSPSHLAHLDALTATLPDAVVVHCHRDPLRAVASYASLIRAVRSPYYPSVDPRAVGRQALARAATAMARALDVRRAADPARFVDVAYRSVVEDPVAVVAGLYRATGRRLAPDVEDGMRRWTAANPQHARGVHRYEAAEFGLDRSVVEPAFSGYVARFGELVR